MKSIDVYKDIYKIKKSILPVLFLNCLMRAIQPFVFIFLSSKLVQYLLDGREMLDILILSVVGATISGMVYLLKNISENLKMEYMDYINCREKNLLIKTMFDLDYEDFQAQEYQDKISRLRQETDGIGGIYFEMLYQFIDLTSSIFTIIIVLISLGGFYGTLNKSVDIPVIGSKYFPMVLIGILVILSFLLVNVRKKAEEKNEEDRKSYSIKYKIYDYYMKLLSNYESMKQIKIYDEKPFIKNQLNNQFVKEGLALNRRVNIRTGVTKAVNELFLTGMNILFLLVLAVKARGGLFGADTLLIYYGAFREAMDAIKIFIETLGYQKALEPKIEILYDVIHMKSTRHKDVVKEKDTDYAIEVENLCFSYPNSDKNQLDGIHVKIKEGEKIAIVGKNGSGKTTFIHLLTGLFRPTSGRVYINEKSPTLQQTSEETGVVSQDFFLFSFKLGENVATSVEYDRQACRKTLDIAGFNQKYSLDSYLYKDIHDDGIEISGGEGQKIALARALYGEKNILFFDEPTSKLDPKSEMQLFERFNEVSKGKTALFVSHRMSACRFADRILLFEDGKILDTGSHEELMKRSEKYFSMWQAQSRYFQ
ncbi:MAG: ABC transporter ATP-binding protein [Tissierellia bacterium]|nr:ABC transporter ATP-binding protein [Tissierellia bacterium]